MLIIEKKTANGMDKCFVAYDSLIYVSVPCYKPEFSKPNLEFYKTFQSEFSSNQK